LKKLILIISLSFLMIFSNSVCAVFAGNGSPFENGDELVPLGKFEITDGLNLSKGVGAAFDKERTISGIAEKDAVITIVVYDVAYGEEDDEYIYEERDSYGLKVGASGLFSETVALEIGTNFLEITAVKGGKESVAYAVIKCKDEGVKLELENGRAIPGKSGTKTI